MKKSIALFGGYRFMDLMFNDGKFVNTYNYVLNKLKLNNEVTNYAKLNYSLDKQINLIKNMTKVNNYNEIYLSLGEYESQIEPSNLLLFIKNIKDMLNDLFVYLKNNKINTFVELLPEDSKGVSLINKVVRNLCLKYKITIINDNKYIIKQTGKKVLEFASLYI